MFMCTPWKQKGPKRYSFMLQLLYHRYPLNIRLGMSQIWSLHFKLEQNLFLLTNIKQFLGHPGPNDVTYFLYD